MRRCGFSHQLLSAGPAASCSAWTMQSMHVECDFLHFTPSNPQLTKLVRLEPRLNSISLLCKLYTYTVSQTTAEHESTHEYFSENCTNKLLFGSPILLQGQSQRREKEKGQSLGQPQPLQQRVRAGRTQAARGRIRQRRAAETEDQVQTEEQTEGRHGLLRRLSRLLRRGPCNFVVIMY